MRVWLLVGVLAWGSLGCNPKVLVLGLDGANWAVLEPLIDNGYVPHLAKLVQSGARADLDCEPASPPTSCFCPPVWMSIATGQPAGVHRIASFFTPSTNRRAASLWDLVHRRGGRSTLLAYRGTWPPDPTAEVVLTEPGAEVAASQLFDTQESNHPGADDPSQLTFPVDLLERLGILPYEGERRPTWEPFAKDRVSMATLLALARERRDELPWEVGKDLTMLLLHSPDKSEHMSWPFIQPAMGAPIDVDALLAFADAYDGPVYRPPPFQWSEPPTQYQEIDAWLGELLAETAYDYVVIVSDHGMTTRLPDTSGLPGAHDPPHTEAHRGIFAVSGPGVAAGAYLGTISVLDVAPTIAYLLGMPAARDLPGHIVEEAFMPERLELIPPLYVDSWD